MRIVIADDEYWARESLISMLRELSGTDAGIGATDGAPDIRQAANGAELLELAARFRPDIAFVDIRMPKLNGLESIRQARTTSPLTQWVILTGYAEFEYARDALQLGVAEYALKPIDLASLAVILRKLAARIEGAARSRLTAFESALAPLAHNPPSPFEVRLAAVRQAARDADPQADRFAARLLVLDGALSRERTADLTRDIRALLQPAALAAFRRGAAAAALAVDERRLWAFGAWRSDRPDGRAAAAAFLAGAARTARDRCGRAAVVTSFLSEEQADEEIWLRLTDRLLQLAAVRMFRGFGTDATVAGATAERDDADAPKVEAAAYLELLAAAFADGQDEEFLKRLLSCEYRMAEADASKGQAAAEAASFLAARTGIALSAADSWPERVRRLGDAARRRLDSSGSDGDSAVRRTIRYIESEYMNDIGIAQAAERLKLTPNYLSHLFHRETGTTFKTYLTQIRMLKAKELLADPGKKIRDVAEAVGYYSARHFSKIYFKHYGHFPSEAKQKTASVEDGRPPR